MWWLTSAPPGTGSCRTQGHQSRPPDGLPRTPPDRTPIWRRQPLLPTTHPVACSSQSFGLNCSHAGGHVVRQWSQGALAFSGCRMLNELAPKSMGRRFTHRLLNAAATLDRAHHGMIPRRSYSVQRTHQSISSRGHGLNPRHTEHRTHDAALIPRRGLAKALGQDQQRRLATLHRLGDDPPASSATDASACASPVDKLQRPRVEPAAH